ncbi:MAG TPA: type II toxin-antitoxin system HicB family antitoxin [Longimicrobium sp.]|nr:type II toxin-antitoxin system HicB family antitoxin [Longimicrobium sp.]
MKPVFEKIPGGYVAWVDGLPGALTQGDTLDEARENLADAVKLVLETRRIDGAMDAAGLRPPPWISEPPNDRADYDADPHRPMIRHPFFLGLDHFLARP